MTGWVETPLGDVIEIFDSIRVPLSAAQRATRKGPYPYYGAQGIIDSVDDYLFEGRYLLIPEDGENLNSRKLPIAYFADGRFWVNNHAHIIRGKPDKADDVFLKHAINSTDISGFVTGAAQPKLTQANLRRISLLLPPLSTQRRIASILGAYDDLLEANRRRIAVLEQMARGLFEEWFLRFHFPGHEAVAILETPGGPLPEGWGRAPFGSLFEHTIGGLWGEGSETPSNDQRVAVIRGTDFPKLLSGNYTTVPDRYASPRELTARRFCPGDLILEASGGGKDQPVGRVLYVTASLIEKLGPPVAPASFCRLLRPNNELKGGAYLYGFLQAMYRDGRIEKFQKQSTGLRNLSMKQLAAETVTVPSGAILTSFNRVAVPLLEAASIHRHECAALSASRDLLLPRLISGQLSVAAADHELDKAA